MSRAKLTYFRARSRRYCSIETGEDMPFTVQQLIESHQEPVTVSPKDSVKKVLMLMIEHDFSQLPVVDEDTSSSLRPGKYYSLPSYKRCRCGH